MLQYCNNFPENYQLPFLCLCRYEHVRFRQSEKEQGIVVEYFSKHI